MAASPGRDRTDKPATRTRRGGFPDSRTRECQVFLRENMTDDSAKPIKTAGSDRSKPIDIVERLRDWADHYDRAHATTNKRTGMSIVMHAAADEIERLRTIMYRVVDEDCTVAIQNGTFYADDEPLFAISDTTKPRNGAVRGPDPDSRVWETYGHTPDSQPTPGECSAQEQGTSERQPPSAAR